jgi:hypothetical protein
MTLTVDTVALPKFARQLQRASEDSRAARRYLEAYADTGESGGELIKVAAAGHRHATEAVTGTLEGLACMLDFSAAEISRATNYYRNADLRAAASADAALAAMAGSRCPTAMESAWATQVCEPPAFIDS